MKTPFLAGVAIAALLVACTATEQPTTAPSPTSPRPPETRLVVVATTTVLADMARNVAGERADVYSLVPQGGDVHTFDPSPSDARVVSTANLLVMNGLGLDNWLADFALQAGASDVLTVRLAEELREVEYLEGGHDHHDEDEDDHEEDEDHDEDEDEAFNPHLWMNVAYARLYVTQLVTALVAADPDGEADYNANAAAYSNRLTQLDDWIREQVETVPGSDRRIVTFHDAFPYFAAAYGLEIVDVLVDVPGQEPSAAEVAALITAIHDTGVRLILAESQFSPRLAETVAAETEAQVASQLYTDSLGDPPADTFEGAMRWNTEQIVGGLR